MAFTSFLSDKQNYTGAAQSAPQPATSSQLFQDASFSSSSSIPTGAAEASSTPTPSLPSSSDLFAASAYDPAKLHPLASLGDNLDYLALEDAKVADLPGAGSALPSRGWSDELCYGTGSTYLSGQYGLVKCASSCTHPFLRSCSRWSMGIEGGHAAAAGIVEFDEAEDQQHFERVYEAWELFGKQLGNIG